MARKRNWEIDWAGPHGTAWGTVNACLTTITLAVAGHFTELWWPARPAFVALVAFVAGVVAVVLVLLRASLGPVQPRATTVYQFVCVTGADLWIVYVTGQPSWPVRWCLTCVGALAAMAIVAGVLAGLASPEKPTDQPSGAPRPFALFDRDQAARNKLAAEWEERLNRLTNKPGWQVPGIEMWERGNGYTVEAQAPAGGLTWRAAEQARAALEGDLDLVYAGAVVVQPGTTKRAALIEVTTKDILAEDYPYPVDREPHSIRDDLRVGLRDDGSPIGPNLLQKCMLLAGETGSGKTNASFCLTAEIVTTTDALLWDWELTGGGLWAPWMQPWLDGEVKTPPIDWCAFDAQELLWMTRAALRIGYTRKPGYRKLMLQHDDDKVPVGYKFPDGTTLAEIILMGDEIAKVTGSLSEHLVARENLRLISFELRAAAIREVFLALRGTDDVISSSIQSQCHVKGVMKIANKAEAAWVFGSYSNFGPEDTPYEGCGGLSLASGAAPVRMKYHRMLPSTIRRIVLLAEGRRPRLDELSRLAANGRHPDGTPYMDLLPGELDCYDTRWDRYRKAFDAAPAGGGSVPPPAVQPGAGVAVLPEQSTAELEEALRVLDQAARAKRPDDGASPISDTERAEFERIMAAEGFDWSEDEGQVETPPQPGDEAVLLELLGAAGPGGIGPQALRDQLAGRGIVISRDTLHERLKALRKANQAHQPRYGKWALGPKP